MSMPMVELIAYTEGSLDDASAERFLRACEDHCTAMSWVDETAKRSTRSTTTACIKSGCPTRLRGRDRG
jgi:hypothetical protein